MRTAIGAVLLLAICAEAGDKDLSFKQLKSGVQCSSDDDDLGKQPTVADCAKACWDSKRCAFFI